MMRMLGCEPLTFQSNLFRSCAAISALLIVRVSAHTLQTMLPMDDQEKREWLMFALGAGVGVVLYVFGDHARRMASRFFGPKQSKSCTCLVSEYVR
jgi:hypothetical protein